MGRYVLDKLERFEDEIDKPGGLREIKHHYANVANTASIRLDNLDHATHGRVARCEYRLNTIEETDRSARHKLAMVAASGATLAVQLMEWFLR